MKLGRVFSLTFAFFLLLYLLGNPNRAEIDVINDQIQQLEEMKMGYEARALKHENQAEYLQFNDRANLETRRHLQIADENRQKAMFIQQQIDQLRARKDKLQS